MRISDWSSDVCSSDLRQRLALTSLVSSDISSLSDVAGFFRITDAMDSFEAIDQVFTPPRRCCYCMLACTTCIVSPHQSGELPCLTSKCTAKAMSSEEHTSELQSLMRISYAVFCLKTKTSDYLTTGDPTSLRH